MVMIKNALYACAMYVVGVVALYGFNASVGGPPNKKTLRSAARAPGASAT